MAVSWSTRVPESVYHVSNSGPSAVESLYDEIEDDNSAYRTDQQQEPGYLQPVNSDHVQVPHQEAAIQVGVEHNQAERETNVRCRYSRLVIGLQ